MCIVQFTPGGQIPGGTRGTCPPQILEWGTKCYGVPPLFLAISLHKLRFVKGTTYQWDSSNRPQSLRTIHDRSQVAGNKVMIN